MESKLVKIIDGPEHEINVFVHGYSAVTSQKQLDAISLQILAARPAGKVYLLMWKSGNWRPSPLSAVIKLSRFGVSALKWIRRVPKPTLPLELLLEGAWQMSKWKLAKKRAKELGTKKFAQHLGKIKHSESYPVNLIGHSLGARAIHWFLYSDTSSRANINDVVFLGGAATLDDDSWEYCCESVNGQLFNVYSKGDMILALSPERKFVGRHPIRGSKIIRNRKTTLGHREYWDNLEWVLSNNWDGFNQAAYPLVAECPYGCSTDVLYLDGSGEQECPNCLGPILVEEDDVYAASESAVLCECPCGGSHAVLDLNERGECPECEYDFERAKSGRVGYVPYGIKCPHCQAELEHPDGPNWVECPECGEDV